MFLKEVIVDGKDHLLGRLAAIVAKELLNGQRVIVVRAERICVSGSLFRNKLKYKDFLRKRMNTNPRKGPIHHKNPSRIFWRSVRGMLPYKTPRGAHALARLKVFEGCPPPYDQRKKRLVPDALRQNRIRNFRKFCKLGDLMAEYGWKYRDLIENLEQKRKERATNFYQRQVQFQTARRQAQNSGDAAIKGLRDKLAQLGY
jgi:large subunit ribosomal protein L13Ae